MALETLRRDGDIYWEWPHKCSGWSTTELNQLRREAEKIIGRSLRMVRADACQVGMRDDNGNFTQWVALRCTKDHPHSTLEGHDAVAASAYYPDPMIRRLVKGFAKDLRGQDFAGDFWAMSALQDYEEQLYGIESGIDTHLKKMPEDNVTLDKVKSWLMDLHILGGHMSKTNMKAMLQRRGCPSWQQALVGELICDACTETQDTQHQAAASLSMPPKLWQTVKLDCFELEVHHRKLFAVLYMDAACKLAAYFEPSGAQVLSAFLEDWWQHKPQCQFLISDPGGGFVSNQLREWCGEHHPEPGRASGCAPAQWAHGTNHQGYQFAEEAGRLDGDGLAHTELHRPLAERVYLEEQARSVATRLRHSMRQKLLSIKIGDWIMYYRRGKNTGSRGSRFGPARVLAIEPKVNLQRERADESASIEDEISAVWIAHGTRLIRRHPTQLRSSSQREVVVASLKGNIDKTYQSNQDQVKIFSMEIGVNLMTGLRLETTVQTYIQFLERFPQICLEYLSQRMRRVRSKHKASPYDASYGPEATSAAPEDITSGPAGALIGDEASVVPREGSPAEPFGVGPDSADGPVAEGFAGNQDPAGGGPTSEADERDLRDPEAKRIKLGEMDLMTRDFVDEVKYLDSWDNLHNQSAVYLKDTTIEREVIEVATDFIHIGASLQDFTAWLSKRLGDGKATEVTYSKLAPGQQLEFDEAMCKEISQDIATKVLKRIVQEELTEIDESRLLKMRWVLTCKYQEGGARMPKARLVILGYQHPSLTELATAAPTPGKLARNMLFQVRAQHKFKLKLGDVSSALLQTDASEEFESLNVKVIAEVAHAFPDELGRPSQILKMVKSFCGLTTAPRAWWLDIARKLRGRGWRQLRADQSAWILLDSNNQLKGIIGVHVDDFIIGGDETSKLYGDAEKAIRDLYRWGAWTSGRAEFSGLRARQFKDFSITLDLYISDMANANKLVKDMRKSASQVIKFHQFENYDWHELWMVQWDDASDKLRPDGSKTGGLVTGLSTPDFANGSMANVSILGWRSFKLPRKISGSNNNETQSTAFADEMLWLSRLMRAELHGVEPTRWKLDDTVKIVPGMLITDSRGMYDAILKSESPQLGMRSFRSGGEARGIKEQILRTGVSFRWVNGLAMLADSLTKPGYPARHVMEEFLTTQRWKCIFDEMFQSGRRRQRDGKGAFADAPEEAAIGGEGGFLDPLESSCDDSCFSESTRSLMRSRCV
ncbi:unnamed protein product [Prorocentrum cordatum]|uniref:Reverse transcriptase Ty1/copia-type domain-containing protein n=1 Tax=Prorocentrum cordatum TaxID=2364126 RepID=A0ABN9PRQ2_9DINO|nr:unnamed protein product [Polarella glacialis]